MATAHLRRFGLILILALTCAGVRPALADEVPVVTILADFDDDSVAASLGDLQNILPTGCSIHRQAIPALGRFSLATELGATVAGVSVACELRLREPRRFAQADRISAFYWLNEGEFQFAFRIRDARDQVFETGLQTIHTYNQWVHITADLDPQKLQRVGGSGALVWPIELQGYRIVTQRMGKQTLFLDELQVEHRVERSEMVHGTVLFTEPTHVYAPGAMVGCKLELENLSRSEALRLSVEMAWTRPDGAVSKTDRATVTLPASGTNFRARQAVDFSQRIDQPGLYRLVARSRAGGWSAANVVESSVAVAPSNRQLQRGDSLFYAVRADLLRESAADQQVEVAVARDIGVQMFGMEAPWRSIEPAPGKLDLAALDALVDALVRKEIDLAPLIIVTDPPAWAATGPQRVTQLGALLVQLAQHYGPKVSHYQVETDVLAAVDWAAMTTAVQQLQERLRAVRPNLHLISPPLPLDQAAQGPWPDLSKSGSGAQWCLATQGPAEEIVGAWQKFRAAPGRPADAALWWYHRAEPLVGPTYFVDAENVLRRYVHAALVGVRGLIWYDLRDDDNDPTQPDDLRGLTRRDFSPKASLLGYVTAVGMLAGSACRGPVLGTPPEFESALFVRDDRQVAVLLPKPNRIYPAVLAPIQGVPGPIEVRDFERRPVALLSATTPPLVPASRRPLFITLTPSNAQPEPQIALVKPWLHVPGTAFCGVDEPLTIEIDAGIPVEHGSLQVVIPSDAPFAATPARQSFKAEAGKSVSVPVRLAAKGDATFERSAMTLKVYIEGQRAEVPLEVRPIATIPRGAKLSAFPSAAENKLGALLPPAGVRATASGTVFAACEPDQLHLAIVIKDDRFVPDKANADGSFSGDNLFVGFVVEGAPAHVEARVDSAVRPAALVPAYGMGTKEQLATCHCEIVPGGNPDERCYVMSIPAAVLGASKLEPGMRVLLAVRYVDDDADGLPAVPLTWGTGLDGRRTAEDFRWTRLGGAPGK